MIAGGSIGFFIYVIPLLLLTGLILLRVDVKKYSMVGMQKEKGVSQFLGWFNIILGLVLFIGNWVLQNR